MNQINIHEASEVSRTNMAEPVIDNRDTRTPLLELRGVNKTFGAVQVLHGVDLTVYPGEVVALVGDNGAGKTTLVKSITGIYTADSGEFFFNGAPSHIKSPKDASDL